MPATKKKDGEKKLPSGMLPKVQELPAGQHNVVVVPEELSRKKSRLMALYIERNLQPRDTPYTLKNLAEDEGRSYVYIRGLAGAEGWNKRLNEIIHERKAAAIRAVREVEVVNEVEIRTRQARFARLAQNKAILRLQNIDPNKLSVREAIELLKLGLIEERRALGLQDEFTPPQDPLGIPESEGTQHNAAVKRALALVEQIAKKRSGNVIDA